MENVKGILSSVIKGENIFGRIVSDLKSPVVAVKETGLSKSRYKGNVGYAIYSLVERSEDRSSLKGSEYQSRPK